MSPIAEQIAKKVLKIGAEYAKAQLRKDAQNRYSLTSQWILPLIGFDELPAGDYDGQIVHLSSDGARVLVWYDPFVSSARENHCDGATGVPDVLLGIDLRPGALAHDVGYDEMEEIAKAFGVPVSVVRKFFDQVFVSITLAENDGRPGCRTVATVANWVIRAFGGLYHKSGRGALKTAKATAVALLAAICVGGCAGCVQTSFENTNDYVSPKWEKTA